MGKTVKTFTTHLRDPLKNVQNRRFFRIDQEEKLSIAHVNGSEPQRGYSKVGAENSSSLYKKGLLGTQITQELRDARVSG